MLKAVLPSLLLLLAGGVAAQAADTAPPASPDTGMDSFIGFEFGVGYHFFNDRRFTGTNTNFGLVIPFHDAFDVVIYHESGDYEGKDSAGSGTPALNTNVNVDINEMRFRVKVWDNGNQAVKLQVGAGYGTYTFDMFAGAPGTDNINALVADIGADVTALSMKTGPIKGNLNVIADYRYSDVSTQDIFGPALRAVTDLSNFTVGISASLLF